MCVILKYSIARWPTWLTRRKIIPCGNVFLQSTMLHSLISFFHRNPHICRSQTLLSWCQMLSLTTRPSIMYGFHVSLLRNNVFQTSSNMRVSSTNYAQCFVNALSRNNSFVVWFSFLICNPKYPPRSVSHLWLGWIEIQTSTTLLT